MREIIVVSMMMGKIGIKITHLHKLLYACLTEANLGGFVPSPMSLQWPVPIPSFRVAFNAS